MTKDLTLYVTPDGNATLVIKYNVIVPSYGVYFSTNGSYVAPITGHKGDAVTAPANPTRAGYTFAGWDTNGDGKADALPAAIPDHDVNAVALWKPATASYLVKYWGEDSGRMGSYHPIKTVSLTGVTGSTTPAAARLDTSKGAAYQWYTYLREDPVRIAGDGTSVLNVYYDWKTVKVYFNADPDKPTLISRCPRVGEPITVKLTQTFKPPDSATALTAYRTTGGTKSRLDYWYDFQASAKLGQNPSINPPAYASYDADGNLYAYVLASFTDGAKYAAYVGNDYQTADSKGYSAPTFTKWDESQDDNRFGTYSRYGGLRLVAYRVSTNMWDGSDQSKIKWGEWHEVTAADILPNGRVNTPNILLSQGNAIDFRWDRLPYDVTYYSQGHAIATRTQLVGSKVDVSTPEGLTGPDGMVFGGWYASPDFSGSPVTSLAMPEGGTHLYARWKHPDVRVTFDSADGPSAATAASYTVIHRTQDGRVLLTQTGRGAIGQTVTQLALGKGDARRADYAYVNASGITRDLSTDASKNVFEFVYSSEPSFTYTVHFYNEKDGLPVAADVTFGSERALLDYAAPRVRGYHVLFGGQGYLSTRKGGQELTFWYERDPERPATPQANGGATSTAGQTKAATLHTATAAPAAEKPAARHMAAASAKAALPKTGDDTLPAGGIASAGMLALLAGVWRRRRA